MIKLRQKLLALLIMPLAIGSLALKVEAAPSSSASQVLSAVLGAFLNVEAEPTGAVTNTTIDSDTGNLAASLISKFKIQSNQPITIYLQGKTESDTSATEVAFFQKSSTVYVVLSNTTAGLKPTSVAIADCKSATPSDALNPNAIAYPITSVSLVGPNSPTSTYDATKNQYNINVKAGQTTATTSMGTTVLPGTYSYLDSTGTYQATVTMTSTSL